MNTKTTYYFYKKERREIIPVKDNRLNEKAKLELERIKKSKDFKKIPSLYRKNWQSVSLFHTKGDIEKANYILINPKNGAYSLKNKLNDLTGKEWTRFVKSWFVFDGLSSDINEEKTITKAHGLNSEEHPATFSPTMIEDFVKFFTKENQIVIDPFVGIGTTLVACDRLKRKGIGIDLNKKYVDISKARTNQLVINGNSLEIDHLLKSHGIKKINFSISSPPYWDILNRSTGSFRKNREKNSLDIQYSDNKNLDLGNVHDYNDFIDNASLVYKKLFDFMDDMAYLVIIVKNIKKEGTCYPLAWDLARRLGQLYVLKDEKIWCQDKIGLAPFGYPYSWTSNIVHHYCLIFRKESK